MRSRRIVAVAASLWMAACTGGAPRSPSPAPATGGPPPASLTAPPSAPISFTVGALRRAVSRDGLAEHLRALHSTARANGGVRSAGTPGYAASVRYAESVLRSAGLRVRLERFMTDVYRDLEPPVLEGGGLDLRDGRDFRSALHSASGDVSGPVVDAGTGCSAPGGANGAVVVVRYGGCSTRSKVALAQTAGAVAVLVVRTDSLPGAPIRPTLGDPQPVRVPVLALTPDAGDAIASVSELRVVVRAERARRAATNVIAEAGPSAGPVVMAGAHLDSVIDGPGINDNGSGVAAVLELGEALGRTRSPARVRLGLWAAEEYGLIGATHHVNGLDDSERDEIEAYLNVDMIGSPNAASLVYAGSSEATRSLADGLRGLPFEYKEMTGTSDHAPFEAAGIPVSGLFTGALDVVSQGSAAAFGSRAGEPADACYHQPCDGIGNVDVGVLERMADALAQAVVMLSAR